MNISLMEKRRWAPLLARRRADSRALIIASGIGIGAGTMYLLDRDNGRRRRALLANELKHLIVRSRRGIAAAAADLMHRVGGSLAEIAQIARGTPVDDVLVARVRARLGRLVGHPHAIAVEANQGRVILRGAVLATELDKLMETVRRIPGVKEIENQLTPHLLPDEPSLQGPPRHHLRHPRPGYWPPGIRLLAGSSGGLLLTAALLRRGRGSTALSTLGSVMLMRALSNRTVSQLIGIDRRRGIEFRKSITIEAPVDQVFRFLDNAANFNLFMSHIREVRDLGGNRSQWILAGPAGVSISWAAVQLQRVPGEMLAWASVPGSVVGNALWLRFAPDENNTTRLDLQVIYDPPGGVLGHLIAKLLGADPKRVMDEDLVRLKSLLEIGKTTVHGQVVIRPDVQTTIGAPPQPTMH